MKTWKCRECDNLEFATAGPICCKLCDGQSQFKPMEQATNTIPQEELRRAWDMYAAVRLSVGDRYAAAYNSKQCAAFADEMLAEREKRFPSGGAK